MKEITWTEEDEKELASLREDGSYQLNRQLKQRAAALQLCRAAHALATRERPVDVTFEHDAIVERGMLKGGEVRREVPSTRRITIVEHPDWEPAPPTVLSPLAQLRALVVQWRSSPAMTYSTSDRQGCATAFRLEECADELEELLDKIQPKALDPANSAGL